MDTPPDDPNKPRWKYWVLLLVALIAFALVLAALVRDLVGL